ncbi:MAG: CoA transferase [Gammaproteobacteria bacterium]|nr:CoA transferase [Gammaproteobacteria bacterium]
MSTLGLPLATCADQTITKLAGATGSDALAKLEGATLLGERAMLEGLAIPGRKSAGGGCQLFEAMGDTIALNLSRPADRELLPALFETEDLNTDDHEAIAARIARSDAAALVTRGRSMGLAIAAENETVVPPVGACVELVTGCAAATSARHAPRVVDLSALWAGPLAAHLLWLAGADVVKVESRTRPDAMREGNNTFYALLNQGKASVVLDFGDANDRQALLSLIATSDIVIEAARPRALAQLGIDAARIVRTTPGLVWLTITGHGAIGEAANWVGFGDDCGVSGGLSAALRAASGRTGFVGDAIADPLTGVLAALIAWEAWTSRQGGRFGLAMSRVIERCLAVARDQDPAALQSSLTAWSAAAGRPFPTVNQRPIGALPSFGANTRSYLATPPTGIALRP